MRRVLLAAVLALPLSCSLAAPAQSPEALLNQYFASFFGDGGQASLPGFAVLVKKNGKPVYERGFGLRDLRGKARIDAHSNFRLASCTKQFTAMAIMLLVHDGKLGYDEPLTAIFPEFPGYGRAITVRNLLQHTGGLPDYEDLMDAREKGRATPLWTAEQQIQDGEVLQLLEKETRGKFAPGTRWDYSNSGYVVLGLIVAKRSGKPFGEFLHERIFAPLKMDHTRVYEKGKNQVTNRAYGHSLKDGVFAETDQSSTSATLGDGGVYSNVSDLSKWDDALREHTLLSEAEFAPALTPAMLPAGSENKLAEDTPASLHSVATAYGFGWFLDLAAPHPMVWHYGETIGFKTAILRYTRDNVTVILLCNRSDVDQGLLAQHAAAPFFAKVP